jgi:hypothetical protein
MKVVVVVMKSGLVKTNPPLERDVKVKNKKKLLSALLFPLGKMITGETLVWW